jgi:glycosyltransferase involved in cell wall biosynthesis
LNANKPAPRVFNKLRPKVSVVIPAYNESRYIGKALETISAQNYDGAIEVLVVDNNCTDQTAKIAHSYGARVIDEANPGVCWARHAGTGYANGDIVVSTDADTYFHPEWIKNIVQLFEAGPDIVAVTGPCRYVDGPSWSRLYTGILFGIVSIIYRIFGFTVYASAANLAFKKSAWQGYNTNLTQGGDELDLIKNLRRKGRVVFNSRSLTYTSSRRLTRGFFYSLFVSLMLYYIIEYNLSRLFNRPVFGASKCFREDKQTSVLSMTTVTVACLIGAALVITRHALYPLIDKQALLLLKHLPVAPITRL